MVSFLLKKYCFLYSHQNQGAGLFRLSLHVSAPADFECLGLISADQKTNFSLNFFQLESEIVTNLNYLLYTIFAKHFLKKLQFYIFWSAADIAFYVRPENEKFFLVIWNFHILNYWKTFLNVFFSISKNNYIFFHFLIGRRFCRTWLQRPLIRPRIFRKLRSARYLVNLDKNGPWSKQCAYFYLMKDKNQFGFWFNNSNMVIFSNM